MKLQEFVQSTLVEIEEGVKQANQIHDQFTVSGADIEFDVAVVVSSADETGGSLKIAYVIEAGGGTKNTETNQVTSRIQFKVKRKFNIDNTVASPRKDIDQLDPYQ